MRPVWIGVLAGGPRSVAVGPCALAVHGAWGLPIDLQPQISAPGATDSRPGEPVRVRRFESDRILTVRGIRVIPPERALAQSVCEMFRSTAISVLDSALNRGVLRLDGLDTVRRLVRGRRGAARTHDWWHLVDPRAESPIETRARLIFSDAGLPPTALQVPVLASDGSTIGFADMGWRRPDGGWVAVEMDGREFHEAPGALLHDRRRQNDMLLSGTTMLRFTGSDLNHPPQMVSKLRRALLGIPLAA